MIELFVLYQDGEPVLWHELPFYSSELDVKMKFIKKGLSGTLLYEKMYPLVFDDFTKNVERI